MVKWTFIKNEERVEKRDKDCPEISDCAGGSVTSLDDLWIRGELGRGQGVLTGGVNGLREYRQWVAPPCSPVTQPTLPIITEVL